MPFGEKDEVKKDDNKQAIMKRIMAQGARSVMPGITPIQEHPNQEAVVAYNSTLANMQEDIHQDVQISAAPQNLFSGEAFLDQGFSNLMRSMNKKKGWGRKDSAEYTNVKNALSEVMEQMNHQFSDDPGQIKARLWDASSKYSDLIKKCQVYLKKTEESSSKVGLGRRQIVDQLLDLARKDLEYIQHLAFDAQVMSPEELQGLTWNKILQQARDYRIEVDNLSLINKFGGGAKGNDDEKAGRILQEGMFTHENIEEITSSGIKNGDASFTVSAFSQKKRESNGDGQNRFGMMIGDKVNISRRNVAMSRVANLLGIGYLIEQSKSVTVHDRSRNQDFRGNLMTKAKGKKAQEHINTIKDELKTRADKDNIRTRENAAKDFLTPTIQKELSSLQILDYICGQGDRHFENIFIEDEMGEGGKIKGSHIHAIDNDMSFSNGTNYAEDLKKSGFQHQYMKAVVGIDKNLVIPHMDKALADNIKALSANELRFALKDVVEDSFVEFAIERFEEVKNAVQNAKDGVILEENQWNEKTHKDFMKASDAYKAFGLGNENIKGDEEALFMNNTMNWNDSDTGYELLIGNSYYSQFVLNAMGYSDYQSGMGYMPTFDSKKRQFKKF